MKCPQCSNPVEPGRRLCRAHLDYYKSAAKKWREKQLARGLCAVCGKRPFLQGKKHCGTCRDRINSRARKQRFVICTLCAVPGHHRRQHKKLGLCWHCNHKAKRGLCKFHLEEAKIRSREKSRSLRQGRRKAKVCLRCGAESFGKTLCPKHLKYMAQWEKNYRARLNRPLRRRTSGTPRRHPCPG